MKIKSKSMLSIILALNLIFPIGYINTINSYATTITEDEIIDSWETKTNMPTARRNVTSVVVDGKIYCIGGSSDSSSSSLTKVEVYDPATDTWETKANMPTARYRITSAVVDGKIYCIGGKSSDSSSSSYLNTVEVYDPATDTWETKANMPTNRGYLTSSVVDGKIYCIGGCNYSSYLNTLEVYDPITNTWETKANMPTLRRGLTSSVVDGKVYCIGGYNGSSYLNTVEVYDPITNTWETKTSMSTNRGYLTSSVVDGKVYCIGGYNGSSYLNTVEVYDPITNTWETKTSMPTNRGHLTSSVVDGKIYCIGGYDGSSYLNTVEVYVAKISPEDEAREAVANAEASREPADIETARDLVNKLPESITKGELQDRLDAIVPNLPLNPQSATSNVDIYIKPENVLSLSLDTNSIVFENFNGIEDLEKKNAVTLTVSSSLPYEINSYLVSEIQNADGSNKIDIDRLNIKDNDETAYQEFTGVNQKLTLKSNCNAGNHLTHNIDLKLKGSQAYEADIYKTVIKFEAEQK